MATKRNHTKRSASDKNHDAPGLDEWRAAAADWAKAKRDSRRALPEPGLPPRQVTLWRDIIRIRDRMAAQIEEARRTPATISDEHWLYIELLCDRLAELDSKLSVENSRGLRIHQLEEIRDDFGMVDGGRAWAIRNVERYLRLKSSKVKQKPTDLPKKQAKRLAVRSLEQHVRSVVDLGPLESSAREARIAAGDKGRLDRIAERIVDLAARDWKAWVVLTRGDPNGRPFALRDAAEALKKRQG